jgi:hypothetical protein
MANWTRDELDTIGAADELQIVTVRGDGTKRKPVTIWVVRHSDDLYVRSGYGDRAAWYRGTQARRDGQIMAGGVAKDVRFEEAADPALNDRIDAAYPQQIPASRRTMGRSDGRRRGALDDDQARAALTGRRVGPVK